MTSISAKAQKNLRTIVANEDKRLGKVDDRPPFLRNNEDIQEALAARRGDNLGQRTRELKSIARQQNDNNGSMLNFIYDKNKNKTSTKKTKK